MDMYITRTMADAAMGVLEEIGQDRIYFSTKRGSEKATIDIREFLWDDDLRMRFIKSLSGVSGCKGVIAELESYASLVKCDPKDAIKKILAFMPKNLNSLSNHLYLLIRVLKRMRLYRMDEDGNLLGYRRPYSKCFERLPQASFHSQIH